jgi:6-phosphofructokinase
MTQSMHTESVLLGFKGGPKGILHNEHVQLDRTAVNTVRNVGGFHLLGTSRDKIESPADLEVKPCQCDPTAPLKSYDGGNMFTTPEL